MKIHHEENYGADYDGNRGIPITFYDLEPSDEPEIIAAVKMELFDCDPEDYPREVTITMIAPDGEAIDFDIIVKDFL